MISFKSKLSMSGFLIKSSTKATDVHAESTHYLLNGGKLNVPVASNDSFLNLVGDALEKKENVYVVELKTRVFPMFMDVDLYVHDGEDNLSSILAFIHSRVCAFFGREVPNNICISCTAEPKQQTKNGKLCTKYGTHLHWPNVRVSSNEALYVRQLVVQDLTRKFGERDVVNTWEDVVDKCVFERNGLRLVGSRKAAGCTLCRNFRDCCKHATFWEMCDSCIQDQSRRVKCKKCGGRSSKAGTGYIDEGRPYSVANVYLPDGRNDDDMLHRLLSDPHELVKLTSIRCPDTVPTKKVPLNLLQISPRVKSIRKRCRTIPPADLCNHADELAAFIEESMPHNPQVDVKNMRFEGDCILVQSFSRYCDNIGMEHRSNRVWFIVRREGVSQRCHCKCDTTEGRKAGRCDRFKGDLVRLPASLGVKLFGKKPCISLLID